MAGLHGNTHGVGRDIVDYLTTVACHFKQTIFITSGYRNAGDQAEAMFKYWLRLKRGKVYSKKNLPDAERIKLDGFFNTCKADPKATSAERQEAKDSFLALAAEKFGDKSKHSSGRAVDVKQTSVSAAAYRAITMRLKEVKEGRRDIYHFECDTLVSPASAEEKKSWDDLSAVPLALPSTSGTILLAGIDAPCTCIA